MARDFRRAAHRWDPVVRCILGEACIAHGHTVDYDRLGAATATSAKTMRRRMEAPGEFSLDELYGLANALGLKLTVRLEKPGEDA